MDVTTVTRLIYQGVFISIFVIATSITLSLFSGINEYSNIVCSAMKTESLSQVVSENENNYDQIVEGLKDVMSGNEVFAVANNYGMYGIDDENFSGYILGKKYDGTVDLNWKVKVEGAKTIEEIDLNAKYETKYTFSDNGGEVTFTKVK